MMASLYVHLPFCARKCRYCDFESYAGRTDRADEYIDRVLTEADICRREYGAFRVPTAYFGGGTPSILTSAQLERLICGLFERFAPENDAEITMEANPGTVDADKLHTLRRCGVNRISFGVQAAQDGILRTLGRIHTFEEACRASALARDAGFDNLNLDMMFALPGQTEDDLTQTAEAFAALKPEHISCYSLILEPGTELEKWVSEGKAELPDEDEACEMQRLATRILTQKGYERYEISNFAARGRECRHNLVYWQGGDYLGLGCAAHSFMQGERFANPGWEAYMGGSRAVDRERVDTTGRMEETLMLETRLIKGMDLSAFERNFGRENAEKVRERARKLTGLVQVEDGFLWVTEEGLLLHNRIVLELVEAAENG